MRILRMQATFGCLDNAVLELKPGLNVISLPNGAGKSTWCAFLLAMLYGLDTSRRSSRTALSDRERFAPWSGAPMAGRMDLDWDGRRVTLERSSQGKGVFNRFRAYDTRTGREIPELTAAYCGELLLGVERPVYARSAFIGQGGMPVSGDPALEKRLSALVSTGEEAVSAGAAAQALRKYQNHLRYNQTGRIPELEAELDELSATLALLDRNAQALTKLILQHDRLKYEMEQLQNHADLQTAQARFALRSRLEAAQKQAEGYRQTLASARHQADALPNHEALMGLQQALEQLSRDEAAGPPQSSGGKVSTVNWCVFALLTLLASALSVILWPWGLCSALAPLLWLLFAVLRGRDGAEDTQWQQAMQLRRAAIFEQIHTFAPCETTAQAGEAVRRALELPEELSRLETLAADAAAAASALQAAVEAPAALPPGPQAAIESELRKNETAQARLRGAMEASGDREALLARRDERQAELSACQTRYNAAQLALDALERASQKLETRFAPQLSRRAAAILSRLTGGDYVRVTLNRDMQLLVGASDGFLDRSPLSMSQGNADQLYLSLRLAIAEAAAPDAPLVLDDALGAFDDARLSEALRLLSQRSESQQILLFSCSSRETQLLRQSAQRARV